MMINTPIENVSDASFEADVLRSKTPVLVDFWAPWCAPCKTLAPALDALAADYTGKVKFVKFNVDENPAIPARFGIRSIPALMVFKDGQVAAKHIGVLSKTELAGLLDRQLA